MTHLPSITFLVFFLTASIVKPLFATDSNAFFSGYVLTHEHPTYGMAFGGNYAFAGQPGNYQNGVMEKGYTAECGGCKALTQCDHGEVKGNFAAALGAFGGDMGDHKSHTGPLHDAFSHLRYSTEWIKEVFRPSVPEYSDARARIMVAYAVENEAMCEQLYYANHGNGGAGGDGYRCVQGDSFVSLKRQIDNIKAWVQKNHDWMGIALSFKEAQQLLKEDKFVIILGVESDYAFGSEASTFDPVDRLNQYYDMGVRTFYLAHKINSRLSGADAYLSPDSSGGKAIRASQAIAGCFYYDDHIGEFPLTGNFNHKLCDNNRRCGPDAIKGHGPLNQCNHKYSDISEANSALYMAQGNNSFNGFRLYPLPPEFKPGMMPLSPANTAGSHLDSEHIERNNLGLSHSGERVIREAMLKGMIITIDHVSSKARKHIHHIATEVFEGYPLNALHNKPNQMLSDKKGYERHEYEFDPAEIRYIKETGGFFGFRMGPTDSKDYPASGISVNCPDTSTESAKMLAWLIDQGIPVGYSLDYATITQGVYSRALARCGEELGTDHLQTYDSHIAEGLSHIGVMRQWHAELESIGLNQHYIDTLKTSGVNQFLTMWNNSEQKALNGTQIIKGTLGQKPSSDACGSNADCAKDEYCSRSVFRKPECRPLKSKGENCTHKRQCVSDQCRLFKCR